MMTIITSENSTAAADKAVERVVHEVLEHIHLVVGVVARQQVYLAEYLERVYQREYQHK